MSIELRSFDGDWTGIRETLSLAFADMLSDDDWAIELDIHEPDRGIVAVDGKEVVGYTAAYSLQMTVPGGPLPVAGVSMVTVKPTHRRRGILRQLMNRQLAEMYESGAESVAALTASEPEIYGRFGYGLASEHLRLQIPRRPGPTLRPVPGSDEVEIRYADVAGSLDECARIHNEVAATRAGMFQHDAGWRKYVSSEQVVWGAGSGASAVRCVQSSKDGVLTGYAYYRTKRDRVNNVPHNTVMVDRVHATDLASYVAIWKFLLDQDLMTEIGYGRFALDDPLITLLVNSRPSRPMLFDGLWVRLVDLPRALTARTYESDVDVVLGVRDEFCPWNDGSWRLTAGPGGATCERTTDKADLLADVRDLGGLYLGRPGMTSLAKAGLVEELTPGALVQTSRAFQTETLPWLDTGF
ncbi:GNAT family N-acetyltransferase [Kribbella sp. NBC_01245]|uniref:GNAT family N-acetyltransferase n=1 Tax=Kribbella sp. NBC_01245 TaxID=2903578 RepID=UPI002E2C2247|nr:GNAT family N-acetyltransferase [Kribbella sp. NBC_01245]